MTREELIESMARVSWEHSGEQEPWINLPAEMRLEWASYQEQGLNYLESTVPGVREAIASHGRHD